MQYRTLLFLVCDIANSFLFICHSEKRESAISHTGTAHRSSRLDRARANNSNHVEFQLVSLFKIVTGLGLTVKPI